MHLGNLSAQFLGHDKAVEEDIHSFLASFIPANLVWEAPGAVLLQQ